MTDLLGSLAAALAALQADLPHISKDSQGQRPATPASPTRERAEARA